ncbi:MAG: sigma-70 family RNA polymerase sigma factor [Oscillospiraceae bacterium]|nr:sigma-70 family RNA polymerase sigma factor [Oscillospiraceae bacterium]
MIKQSTAELLQKAKQGDTHSFTALVNSYISSVRAIAHAYRFPEKEDLVQEGLIGFIKAVRTFDPNKQVPFKSYVNLCVSSQINSYLKKCRTQKRKADMECLPLDMLDSLDGFSDPSAEDIYINMESSKNLNEQIESLLSGFEQEALKLYLSGHTYSEMAIILNVAPKAVDNALQRIRRKLKTAAAVNYPH